MDFSKYWETIIETLHDGLLIVDPSGIIKAVNPAVESLTGYRAEELIGSSCRILDCTGCDIFGEGPGERWCKLFQDGKVKAKKCLITNKENRSVNIVKNATVLHDLSGKLIGAVETLTDISEIVRREEEILSLKKVCQMDEGYYGILGNSPSMQQLFEMIDSVAQSDAPVVINGQSGTGKELVARAIHRAGSRKGKPFIKVNCASLNENLLESELFGHIKGAYTGADRNRIGRFEAAHGGSIFLDEVGDIPMATQVKLLHVLEEKEIERVGDHTPIKVDVRVITATNKDLEELVSRGLFREDLYFRINVFPLFCPSLAERREDIPLIIQSFIRQNNRKSDKKISGLTPEAIEKLTANRWPGNVRELRNAIEYAFVLCPSGGIGVQHLPQKVLTSSNRSLNRNRDNATFHLEKEKMIEVLRKVGGNQSEAARVLGVSRVTIWKRMKKYGIDVVADLKIN